LQYVACIGAYGGNIYASDYDTATGKLSETRPAAELKNPSWLALSRDCRFLYSAIETDSFEGQPGGGVCALAVDGKTGALKVLNSHTTCGIAPCHLCLDASGKFLFTANYGSGSVSAYTINQDGTIGPLAQLIQHRGSGPVAGRQEGPHAHFVAVAPGADVLLAVDLGADGIFAYRLNENAGELTPEENLTVRTRPGAGPRHMAFHPGGKFAYLLTELSCEVYAYRYTPSPFALTEMQVLSALPAGFQGENTCAAIRISPDGRTLYASNRGHDSIAVFRIDQATGMLQLLQHAPTLGACPREFAIDPTGRFLLAANQESDSIVTFGIEQGSGKLAPTGHVVEVRKPVCIVFGKIPPLG
jgi:6-phosphogluconolactonase